MAQGQHLKPVIPLLAVATLFAISACTPRVEVAVPQEPITINLNVKIEHEILVKVDKEIDELFDENSDLF
ncbi:MAG: YnbE family lipoprotein [Motiliproteus sp.]|nr:YnbE family lipoprotein [Motiliproteus sp.]MCW9051845.1 YnbE family lipoprotein [Motiliproteus sp.]